MLEQVPSGRADVTCVPNTLTNPGEREARARVEEVFARLDDLGTLDRGPLVIPEWNREEHGALLTDLERTADRSGRRALLDEARDAVRDALRVRSAGQWPGNLYGVGLRGPTPLRAQDVALATAAIDDVVAVAVTEDLLDPEAANILAGPGRQLLGLSSLRERASAGPGAQSGPTIGPNAAGDWTPSAQDWADAERGPGAVARDAPVPGERAVRRIFFTATAIVGVPAALVFGLGSGGPLLGILLACAVIALCWTFATYQSIP